MGRHSPNTSEYSRPHPSERTGGDYHVDRHGYDSQGRYDKSTSENHLTDRGSMTMGRASEKFRESQRSSKGSGK